MPPLSLTSSHPHATVSSPGDYLNKRLFCQYSSTSPPLRRNRAHDRGISNSLLPPTFPPPPPPPSSSVDTLPSPHSLHLQLLIAKHQSTRPLVPWVHTTLFQSPLPFPLPMALMASLASRPLSSLQSPTSFSSWLTSWLLLC